MLWLDEIVYACNSLLTESAVRTSKFKPYVIMSTRSEMHQPSPMPASWHYACWGILQTTCS